MDVILWRINMDDLLKLMLEEQQQQELAEVVNCNQKTKEFGLLLSKEDAVKLMENRKESLMESRRVEFGEGILPALILEFCDSEYIQQDNYLEILSQLQEIFYLYKNESHDELTDTELISFMKQQYETICFGDLEYLSGTCLERFAKAIRAGYQSQMQHRLRDEYGTKEENEYQKFSEEIRWDYEVYKLKLEDTY